MPDPANPISEPLARVFPDLQKLRLTMDDHVVGHHDIKEAMMLGLLAREHVYLEGPPGVAKTMLSEIVVAATDLKYWFYQMHRDTRLNELIGESVIVKDSSPKGEVIRHDYVRGGILTCELAVLDDISRAPGEALNVLLRVLNERRFGGGDDAGGGSGARIPLLSAIATGNPAAEDGYFADPLDPATLDRFTLQLRANGLVQQGDWANAEKVIDMYAGPRSIDDEKVITRVNPQTLHDASALVPLVVLGEPAKAVLLRLLRVLREEYGLNEDNSLLTDRTFLVKAISIMKSRALLSGRHVCEPEDLAVISYLTTFRVPEHVHAQIHQIIAQVLAMEQQAQQQANSPTEGENPGDGAGEGGDGQQNQATGS